MGLERRRDTCDDIFFHYLNQYLTFEALDSGTFTLTIGSGVSTSLLTSVSYSIDSGSTWTTANNITNTQVVITTPTIAQGNKVLWKGIGTAMANNQLVFGTAAANRLPLVSNFTSTGTYKVSGNIMSLLYGDNFLTNKEFAEGSSHNFALLFYKASADSKLVSAKNMVFPAKKCPNYAYFRIFQMNSGLEYSPTILASEVYSHGCCNLFYKCSSLKTFPKRLASNLYGDSNYKYAFFGCNSMTKTPEMPASTVPTSGYAYAFSSCIGLTEASDLPATTLSNYSYSCMFYGCTSLTKAPEMAATTLARSCCNAMFSGCVSLTKSPDLPATTLADNCYYNMFSGCTSLVDVPDSLPALVVPLGAYYQMFEDCTSLTRTPNLSGQTIGNYGYAIMFAGCSSLVDVTPLNAENLSYACYAYMFDGCTSLTEAPALPSTTLGEWCYGHMFEGCTSLVNAPVLPAKRLISACYRTMFGNCTNLRYVKCLAEDLGQSESSNPLLSWMSGVPSGGTFYKMNGVTWPSGANGIPTGWNVADAINSDSYIQDGLVFQLDGIDYGGTEGHWIERKNGYDFYEHAGTDLHTENDCMVFDGNSWFLCNDTIANYPDSTHSIEVVVLSLPNRWNSIISIRTDNVAMWTNVDNKLINARGSSKTSYQRSSFPSGKLYIYSKGTTCVSNNTTYQSNGVATRAQSGKACVGALEEEIAHNYEVDRIRFNF